MFRNSPSNGGSSRSVTSSVSARSTTPNRTIISRGGVHQRSSSASQAASTAAIKADRRPRRNNSSHLFYHQINEEEDNNSVSTEQSRQPRPTMGSSRDTITTSIPDTMIARINSTRSKNSGRGNNRNELVASASAEQQQQYQHQQQPRRKSLSPPRTNSQHRRAASSESQHGAPPTHPNTTQHSLFIAASNSSTTNNNNSNMYGGNNATTTSNIIQSNNSNLSDSLPYTNKSVKKVIDDLNKAIGHDRRIAAIANACAEFDHWDVYKHDLEISLGAANVLSLLLSMTSDGDEVQMRMICAALEMVYRASPDLLIKSYAEVGGPLIPVLLRFLESCEKKVITTTTADSSNNNNIINIINNNNNNNKAADVSLLNITKVLLYFSRVPSLRTSIVKEHKNLLHALKRVVVSTTTSDRNKQTTTIFLNPESRVARVRVIANLANAEENRVAMYEYPGLIDSIVTLCVVLDPLDHAREFAAAALMDLAGSSITSSTAPSIQINMATNHNLLNALIKLVVTDHKTETREYAITALQNIAFAKENRDILVRFNNGIILEALKQTLLLSNKSITTNTAAFETNNNNNNNEPTFTNTSNYDKARIRAAGAITNLACKETIERLGNHEGLLDALAEASTEENNEGVQLRAIIALTKIANSITSHMSCHNILLGSLIKAVSKAPSTAKCSIVAGILRAKARMVENRYSMARYPDLLETLSHLAMSSNTSLSDQDDAIRAIMHLTNEQANRKLMGSHKAILDALVYGAAQLSIRKNNNSIIIIHKDRKTRNVQDNKVNNEDLPKHHPENKEDLQLREIIQGSSLAAIERLATDVANRRTMARHGGILVAIAMAAEREAKAADEIAERDPTATPKRLAKALLMSLLVSM